MNAIETISEMKAKGKTAKQIAAYLNRKKIKTKTGRPWTGANVANMVRSTKRPSKRKVSTQVERTIAANHLNEPLIAVQEILGAQLVPEMKIKLIRAALEAN